MRCFLFLMSFFCFAAVYSQKIESKKIDKFDSTYMISTTRESLIGKILNYDYLAVSANYSCLLKAEFKNYPKAKVFRIFFTFKPHNVTAIDNKSEVIVQFADNTFETYNDPNTSYRVVTEISVFGFRVSLGDKLFTTDIKAIRIRTSDSVLDYEIPQKKASYIKNALTLLKAESEKI